MTEPESSISPLASVDLTQRSEVNLLHRSIVTNNWPVSPAVREQIRAQLPAAIEAFAAGDPRSERQRKQLAALAARMDMTHLFETVAIAAPTSTRTRNPNRRQLRALGRQRAREALRQRVIQNNVQQ
jgi:hypothetical protein